MAAPNDQPTAKAVRHSITLGSGTERRLIEFIKHGGHIVLSQVADRAVNTFIDETEKPDRSRLLDRLRDEQQGSGGRFYRMGRQEGDQWARESGTWPDICSFSSDGISPTSVRVKAQVFEGDVYLEFSGSFAPPVDYTSTNNGRGEPVFHDRETGWVYDWRACVAYWQGWLAGVDAIYQDFKDELGWPDGVTTRIEREATQRAEAEAYYDAHPDEFEE